MTTELIDRLRRIAKRKTCNSPDSVTEAADELECLHGLIVRATAELELVEYDNDPPARVINLLNEMRGKTTNSFDRGFQRNENNEGDTVCV